MFWSYLAVAILCLGLAGGNTIGRATDPISAMTEADLAAGKSLKIGVGLVKPFAMERDGALSGFSIDLWNAIAERLGTQTEFHPYNQTNKLLEGVSTGSEL